MLLLLHYGVIWFYHGLNSVVSMLLFTISSVAHKSHFGTGFYGYLTGFSAQRLMQKIGFVCLRILLVCLLCICTNSVLQDLSSSKTTTQTNQGFVFIK